MSVTSLDELFDFIGRVEKQGYLNSNTAVGRRTACAKLFGILDDDQKSVEYVRDNLDVIKSRFQRLNTEVRGQTAEEYARRVSSVLSDFAEWTADRAAWERKVASKTARPNGDAGEKRERTPKQKSTKKAAVASPQPEQDPDVRIVKIQLRSGFEVTVSLPRELSMADLRHIGWTLTPYADDWSERAPQQQGMFQPQLDDRGDMRP